MHQWLVAGSKVCLKTEQASDADHAKQLEPFRKSHVYARTELPFSMVHFHLWPWNWNGMYCSILRKKKHQVLPVMQKIMYRGVEVLLASPGQSGLSLIL